MTSTVYVRVERVYVHTDSDKTRCCFSLRPKLVLQVSYNARLVQKRPCFRAQAVFCGRSASCCTYCCCCCRRHGCRWCCSSLPFCHLISYRLHTVPGRKFQILVSTRCMVSSTGTALVALGARDATNANQKQAPLLLHVSRNRRRYDNFALRGTQGFTGAR